MGNDKETRRGFEKDDDRWFSKDAVKILQKAQEEIIWLLDRGYKMSSVIELVGGHYQLSARQRMALQRSSCASGQKEKRQEKLLSHEAASKGCVYVDGFNLIITLEVALSGSVVLLGSDGCIRDLAGLRGTYRLIDKTDKAIQLIGNAFNTLGVPYAKFFLDAPVSNSGRLKSRILQHAESWALPVEVELVTNPDRILSNLERVITSDSVILDSCMSWFNFSRDIIKEWVKEAVTVDLRNKSET